MKNWLRLHAQTLGLTLSRLAAQPLASALNVLVIGVALALPLGGYMLLQNLGKITRHVSGNPQISVFLAPEAGKADIAALEARFRQLAGVQAVRFVPREQALESLKRSEGMADVIGTLQSNPLPDAFVLETRGSSAGELDKLEREKAVHAMEFADASPWPNTIELEEDVFAP